MIIRDIFNIFYFIFCIICTLIVSFHTFIVLLNAIFTNFDYQIVIFVFLSLALIAAFWSLLFVKIKVLYKVFIFIFLLTVQWNYIPLSVKLPSVDKAVAAAACVDTGICREGIEVRTKVKLNKSNCIKSGWKWNEENKTCNLSN